MNDKKSVPSRAGGNRGRAFKGQKTAGSKNAPAAWQHKLDQYLARAQAWASAGDTVEAENCYQHAEHYFRMIRGNATGG